MKSKELVAPILKTVQVEGQSIAFNIMKMTIDIHSLHATFKIFQGSTNGATVRVYRT